MYFLKQGNFGSGFWTVHDKMRQQMNFSFEFTSPFEIQLEETLKDGVAVIGGTLLAEGTSANGNIYEFEKMEEIAESARGADIYFGTMTKTDPNTGLKVKNAHANVIPNKVGQIMETWVDKIGKKIKFIANIVNTPNFPHLVEEVKKGWGVSIGGKGLAQTFIDAAGKIFHKIVSLAVNHVQLLSPDTPRGQNEAQVETSQPKEVQESMLFYDIESIAVKTLKLTIKRNGHKIDIDIPI